MNISHYEDMRVNSFEKFDKTLNEWVEINAPNGKWHTKDVTTILPGEKYGIGRVDHFMKTSIKSIVNACVKSVVKREGKTGVHTIQISLASGDRYDEGCGEKEKTIVITVHV